MKLSARRLNRTRLARQMLLRREDVAVSDGMRRIVAMQAQSPASPYIALWNRVAHFDPASLDEALGARELVKGTLMRVTLHMVHAEDHWPMLVAMQPTLRAARLNDRRYRSAGLMPEDADAVVPDLVRYLRTPRTGVEIEAWLEGRVDGSGKWMWWALRHLGPLHHAPTGGPWSFGSRNSYVAARRGRVRDPERALQTLVHRYLEGFGPATVADVSAFALVHRPRVRAAIEALADLERFEGPDGEQLYDVPGAVIADEEVTAPPRLMAMWDSILLAHADRTRIVPTEYRKVVTRSNGDVLPTLLVDGYVAGVWRVVDGGIEATAFERLPKSVWNALAEEARSLLSMLADREPNPYRRYDRWWSDMQGADTRLIGT